jgi:5-methylcytosine-specific restriction endonuclease McrA
LTKPALVIELPPTPAVSLIPFLTKHVRDMKESKAWRSAVAARDHNICVFCGALGAQIDHIKPVSKIMKEHSITSREQARACVPLWDINNGRIVCVSCHAKQSSTPANLKRTLGKYTFQGVYAHPNSKLANNISDIVSGTE